MMTMQAHEMFPPRTGRTHPLRAYPTNSPRAMARLVVLAISREDFVQVLYDFCADVARLSETAGGYRLSPALLSALFAEVDDPRAKERVLNLIIAVVSSDGRIADGEEKLFLSALDMWGVGVPRLRSGFAHRRHSLPPEAVYG